MENKPHVSFNLFDVVADKLSNGSYYYIEEESISEMGCRSLKGGIYTPLCCVVAHELAHALIYHSEYFYSECKQNIPFSEYHSKQWFDLYMALRTELLFLFVEVQAPVLPSMILQVLG
ncbi:hypothetical protein [Psychromonas aquimarina]|uniref:hypothetical protein n=1 Tax=Psychromonas aquimarina TaxID=444919 RepID=UPI000491BF78|nr:hypothetical protein [Psychromonas aquimarina]